MRSDHCIHFTSQLATGANLPDSVIGSCNIGRDTPLWTSTACGDGSFKTVSLSGGIGCETKYNMHQILCCASTNPGGAPSPCLNNTCKSVEDPANTCTDNNNGDFTCTCDAPLYTASEDKKSCIPFNPNPCTNTSCAVEKNPLNQCDDTNMSYQCRCLGDYYVSTADLKDCVLSLPTANSSAWIRIGPHVGVAQVLNGTFPDLNISTHRHHFQIALLFGIHMHTTTP